MGGQMPTKPSLLSLVCKKALNSKSAVALKTTKDLEHSEITCCRSIYCCDAWGQEAPKTSHAILLSASGLCQLTTLFVLECEFLLPIMPPSPKCPCRDESSKYTCYLSPRHKPITRGTNQSHSTDKKNNILSSKKCVVSSWISSQVLQKWINWSQGFEKLLDCMSWQNGCGIHTGNTDI